MPGGRGQLEIAEIFGHNLKKLYHELPESEQTLSSDELAVLVQANRIYDRKKGFDYIQIKDFASGYKRFPDLEALDALTKKLLSAPLMMNKAESALTDC